MSEVREKNRLILDIVREIKDDWKNVNYGAKPYLNAMYEMGHVPAIRSNVLDTMYYQDTLRSVILYFLSNASAWRGETARRVKKELLELARYK